MLNGTASQEFPNWYLSFQTRVLENLPRPGGETPINKDVALGWAGNGEALAKVLREALLPSANPVIEPAQAVQSGLLIPVGTVNIAATTTPFVARDRFVLNTKKDAPVKISYLGGNFKNWFLGKEEQPFCGSTLKYGKLTRYSVDRPILKELGGDEKAETTLTELFFLMEKQPNGESGLLLANGYANIFYVKDSSGVLRAVSARWFGGGWGVDADAVTGPDGWRGGGQVFSRDSR